MIVQSLILSHFRNYESLHIPFAPGVNVILGQNAQGKTNLLEALYLCAALRSFRTRRDSEMIRFHAPYGYVKLMYQSMPEQMRVEPYEMEMVLRSDQRKRVKQNGVSKTKISEVM